MLHQLSRMGKNGAAIAGGAAPCAQRGQRAQFFAEAQSVEGRGKALMAAVEEHDLEGILAKRKSDPYRRGVKRWKIKPIRKLKGGTN